MSQSEYYALVCGNRLLANRGNDDGLEIDEEYVYLTHDNGKDLRVWRFLIPEHLSEQELTDAFYQHHPGFRSWLADQGAADEEYEWMDKFR